MQRLPFVRQIGGMAVFDPTTAVQLEGEPQTRVTAERSRWINSGKVVSLRRGLYAIGDVYRKTSLSPAQVANEVYRPSYLSCLWALSSYGVVPDAVKEIVQDIERIGGAVKISGAGALSGTCAGCLLIILPEDGDLAAGLEEISAPLAAEGVRVESVA